MPQTITDPLLEAQHEHAAEAVEPEPAATPAAKEDAPLRQAQDNRGSEGAMFRLHKSPWGLEGANNGEAPLPVVATAPATPEITVPKDYVPSAESAHELYHLDLEAFSGPLDLLLFLIRRHQLDVFDIPMGFICSQYLEYLQVMEDLNIDVAAEFMFMASELLHIKSKLLLPQPESVEEEEETDPRAELVRRLLEYQKFRDAAEQLTQLNHVDRDVFCRPPEKLPAVTGEAPLKEVGIFALVHAFNGVLKRQKPEVRHRVVVEQISLRKRMTVLIDAFNGRESVLFAELLSEIKDKLDIIVTFLAVLELTRMKLLRIYESDTGELYLHPRFEHMDQALERLDGLDEAGYAG